MGCSPSGQPYGRCGRRKRTGLRCGELVALCLIDLDLSAGRLFVRNGKGGCRRYIPVAAGAAECLRRYLRFSRPVLAARVGALEREAVCVPLIRRA